MISQLIYFYLGGGVDILKVLDTAFEGVCRPFKVRVGQVLLSNHSNKSNKFGTVLLYRISNLLDFYARTIKKMLRDNSAFLITLDEYPN